MPDIPSNSASSVPPAIIKAGKEFFEQKAPTFQIAGFNSFQNEMMPYGEPRPVHFPSRI
ncbi:MAG: hypothetical protein ACLQB4_19035 [Beijerinckiaceae bacterium]